MEINEQHLQKLLNYVAYFWDDIDFDYKFLSATEKKLIPEESFNYLKKLIFDRKANLFPKSKE
jgi:hypothetical protein